MTDYEIRQIVHEELLKHGLIPTGPHCKRCGTRRDPKNEHSWCPPTIFPGTYGVPFGEFHEWSDGANGETPASPSQSVQSIAHEAREVAATLDARYAHAMVTTGAAKLLRAMADMLEADDKAKKTPVVDVIAR
jgi:hypothetical protein